MWFHLNPNGQIWHFLTDLLGIGVVVTSSIGGVQQGGHESMDISSDLYGMP